MTVSLPIFTLRGIYCICRSLCKTLLYTISFLLFSCVGEEWYLIVLVQLETLTLVHVKDISHLQGIDIVLLGIMMCLRDLVELVLILDDQVNPLVV